MINRKTQKFWGEHPIVALRRFLFSQFVVKMVSLGRAVFWWETARFLWTRNLRQKAFNLFTVISALAGRSGTGATLE